MRFLTIVCGSVLVLAVLLDAFQSIILPRRPVGRFRITRLFYVLTWFPWRWAALGLRSRQTRDQFYSIYGPLSLLVLFFVWGTLLALGFALIFDGLRLPFRDPMIPHLTRLARLQSCLYVSGTTLVTLGLGDVLPQSQVARLLTVIEAGTGLGFIALVIGYVPVLYTAFSHREVLVALLDARAGSPPSASELLARHNYEGGLRELGNLLAEWERWGAEMLETHISYPLLCYYRSQHDNQSWLAALTTILDVCALLIATSDGRDTRQAQLTFAIGRHTLIDLVHVFKQDAAERRFREAPLTRLPAGDLSLMCQVLGQLSMSPCRRFDDELDSHKRLEALRSLYEPAACALAAYLRVELPRWAAPERERRTDAWKAVSNLRATTTFTRHVSAQATASNLDSHDGDPE